MINDNRYRYEKNTPAWRKAVHVFDKHLKDLPEDVLEELFGIFTIDVPAIKKQTSENANLIKRLENDVETLNLKLQVIKMRSM